MRFKVVAYRHVPTGIKTGLPLLCAALMAACRAAESSAAPSHLALYGGAVTVIGKLDADTVAGITTFVLTPPGLIDPSEFNTQRFCTTLEPNSERQSSMAIVPTRKDRALKLSIRNCPAQRVSRALIDAHRRARRPAQRAQRIERNGRDGLV